MSWSFALLGFLLGLTVTKEWTLSTFIAFNGFFVGKYLELSNKVQQLKKSLEQLEQSPTQQTTDSLETASQSPPHNQSGRPETDTPEPTSQTHSAPSPWVHGSDKTHSNETQSTAKTSSIAANSRHSSAQTSKADPWGNKRPSPQIDLFSQLAPLFNLFRNFLLGGNLIVRSAVIILFFGAALLIKYAAERDLFPIELRLIGLALGGITMLVTGWYLKSKKRDYALILQGGGSGIVYLTIFAAFKVYQLIEPATAFPLLIVFSLISMALSVLQNARSMALLGMIDCR